MINDKEKIRDKIIELMKKNLDSIEMTSALIELKNDVKNYPDKYTPWLKIALKEINEFL